MEKMNAVIAFLRECATKLTDLATELEKDGATPVAEPEKKSRTISSFSEYILDKYFIKTTGFG